MFELHPNLRKKLFVAELPLSTLLMEDEEAYIWLILVPRVPNASKLIDLREKEQLELLYETNIIQEILWKEFSPKQLNVAAIGNKTPQLHIHIIGRFENDPAWPGTVWDHPLRAPLQSRERIKQLQDTLALLKSLVVTHKSQENYKK